MNHSKLLRFFSFGFWLMIAASVAQAVPDKDRWGFWDHSNENSHIVIDHSEWQLVLDKYVRFSEKDQMFAFVYGGVSRENMVRLKNYLKVLSDVDPRELNRKEQLAYWINLYNVLTVDLILRNYPVKSITKLGKGWFRYGPWDDKVFSIQGQELSLNDIEHRILRPFWDDSRVHYAINCASIGCPDLAPDVYKGKLVEMQLNEAGKRFINQSKGANFVGARLVLSKIFDWYVDDFGGKEGVRKELLQFANPTLLKRIVSYKGSISFYYDWKLNEYRR